MAKAQMIRAGRFMWKGVACGCCNGLQWGGESPRECRDCGGSGRLWVNKNGVVVQYPGGPFVGIDATHGRKLWKEPLLDLAWWGGQQMHYGPESADPSRVVEP